MERAVQRADAWCGPSQARKWSVQHVIVSRRVLQREVLSMWVMLAWLLGMEMDSHGGLEVKIRQTESKKKLPNNFVKQTPECS